MMMMDGNAEHTNDTMVPAALGELSEDDDEGRQALKKKFLLARSKEQKNSIFDYVNISSNLLRKVRYGQPLHIAIQRPLRDVVASRPKSSHNLGTADRRQRSKSALHHSSNSWSSMMYRDMRPQSAASTSEEALRRMIDRKRGPAAIRYGKLVRFQADDGGFLMVESDGSIRKAPREYRDDPRTILTIFPRDTVTSIGWHKCVQTSDLFFLAQSRDSIHADTGVVYADSNQVDDVPDEMRKAVEKHDFDPQPDFLTRQSSGKHVNQHMINELANLPSTIWRLEKISSSEFGYVPPHFQRNEFGELVEDETLEHDSFIYSGMAVRICQNNDFLHYERVDEVAKKKRNFHIPSTAFRAPMPLHEFFADDDYYDMADLLVLDQDTEARPISTTTEELVKSPYAHVWLRKAMASSCSVDSHASMWKTRWVIQDVLYQRAREKKRLRRQHAEKEKAKLSAPLPSLYSPRDDADELQPHSDSFHDKHAAVDGSAVADQAAKFREDDMTNQQAERHHAARIIARFMRRSHFSESMRRARDLIHQRLRRQGKLKEIEHPALELSPEKQLQMLQCYKPVIYGTRDRIHGVPAKHIPGLSLTDNKYAMMERRRADRMAKEMQHLAKDHLQSRTKSIGEFTAVKNGYRRVPLPSPVRSTVNDRRNRDYEFQVKLKMLHAEKPHFSFGTGKRPNTAPLPDHFLHRSKSALR